MQDINSVNTYLKIHEDYFLRTDLDSLREILLNCSNSKWNSVRLLTLKEPITILLVSLCAGIWGVDRFMLNKKGTGVLKLFICQLGIIAGIVCLFLFLSEISGWGTFCLIWFIIAELWWLFDVCLSILRTKEYNYYLVSHILEI